MHVLSSPFDPVSLVILEGIYHVVAPIYLFVDLNAFACYSLPIIYEHNIYF